MSRPDYKPASKVGFDGFDSAKPEWIDSDLVLLQTHDQMPGCFFWNARVSGSHPAATVERRLSPALPSIPNGGEGACRVNGVERCC